MRILYNAASARTGGGLSYARRQAMSLARHEDVALTLWTAPWNHSRLVQAVGREECTYHQLEAQSAAGRYLMEQIEVRRAADDADALVFPGNFSPIAAPRPNLTIVQNPNYFGLGPSLQQNRTARRRAKIHWCHATLRRADRIIAISESLARAITETCPWAKSRLVVITSGTADELLRVDATCPTTQAPRTPFLLSLANDYPHKRLKDLVHAYEHSGLSRTGMRLALVGTLTKDLMDSIQSLDDHVREGILTFGQLDDLGEIRWMIENAVAMVSTSELEAYPLTPEEAGRLGTPLLLTDIEAHREAAGKNATYFPVGDTFALADALRDATQLPRRHWTRAVTWDENANQLVECIQGVVR